jgi:hypothetical protein
MSFLIDENTVQTNVTPTVTVTVTVTVEGRSVLLTRRLSVQNKLDWRYSEDLHGA